jgi:hypothetical protein
MGGALVNLLDGAALVQIFGSQHKLVGIKAVMAGPVINRSPASSPPYCWYTP